MKMIKVVMASVLLLAGCQKKAEDFTSVNQSTEGSSDILKEYQNELNERVVGESWTATVQSKYTLTYTNQTVDAYVFEGVLESSGDRAHFIQHINGDGTSSELEGYYHDGRLYNTYNTVTYYEDMAYSDLKKTMLVPLDPYVFQQADVASIQRSDTAYQIELSSERAKDIFANRYDVYGFGAHESFAVHQNRIELSFDHSHHFVKEKVLFESSFTLNEQTVQLEYQSEVAYLKYDQTDVLISDEMKQQHSGYVHYRDIDTNAIATETTDDDVPGNTVTDTLKKRLVSRLGYTQDTEDSFSNSYNENERYTIDFINDTFTYSNRSIVYVYSWKGDSGSLGACQYDFKTDNRSSSCEDSTVESIRQAKLYLQMELYYCGISLESLQAE